MFIEKQCLHSLLGSKKKDKKKSSSKGRYLLECHQFIFFSKTRIHKLIFDLHTYTVPFVGSAKEETSTPSGGAEYLDRRTGTVSSVNAIITEMY